MPWRGVNDRESPATAKLSFLPGVCRRSQHRSKGDSPVGCDTRRTLAWDLRGNPPMTDTGLAKGTASGRFGLPRTLYRLERKVGRQTGTDK